MSTEFYEIIMLPDGDFALQRSDEGEEPLVRIRFSEEAKNFLQGASIDVVKAMIDAGIEALELAGIDEDESLDAESPETLRVLH